MALGCDCREHSPDAARAHQLGVGDYVGRVARSAALDSFHLSTVIHVQPAVLPDHAHDWPFLSTLIRGSYVSRTRTRELEFKHGVAVYHPRFFNHCDEIGRSGATFFGLQFDPAFLHGADSAASDPGGDLAILGGDEAYVLLGALYAELNVDADAITLESLSAELAGCVLSPQAALGGTAPVWLKRTVEQLAEDVHVTLHELACDAGVHPTTLTRHFRRHQKCSIGEFQARAKIRRALFAVLGSQAPLSELCHDTGYADQSHMTRAFRRRFGATPGQLRHFLLDR